VKIALGAGCIRGRRMTISLDEPGYVHGEAIAVPTSADLASRRADIKADGTFCIRYLSPGAYSLYMHSSKSGYCRLEELKVPAALVDVGEHKLTPGATVIITIHFPWLSRQPTELVATDSSGVLLRHEFPVYSSYDRFEFGGLWPGRWTLSALSGEEVLATSTVDVGVGGTLRTDLVAKSIRDK
jgi:hypothetical protein